MCKAHPAPRLVFARGVFHGKDPPCNPPCRHLRRRWRLVSHLVLTGSCSAAEGPSVDHPRQGRVLRPGAVVVIGTAVRY